ncbi:uncharacterized protein [Struthio camelus]|uniref:uncharacterized protein n=1 Tax=Struthio camelus TaxID=8801 RepID=UPI003603BC10
MARERRRRGRRGLARLQPLKPGRCRRWSCGETVETRRRADGPVHLRSPVTGAGKRDVTDRRHHSLRSAPIPKPALTRAGHRLIAASLLRGSSVPLFPRPPRPEDARGGARCRRRVSPIEKQKRCWILRLGLNTLWSGLQRTHMAFLLR